MDNLTQTEFRASFSIIVISICNGIGIPLVALITAIKILQTNGIQIQFEYTLTVEKNREANRINQNMMRTHEYPGQVQHMDNLEDLPAWINQHMQKSQDPDHITNRCFILVLSGTPCKSISQGARMNPNRLTFGIHASPSNLWFYAYQSIYNIARTFDASHRIIFVENVVAANKVDTEELDKTAGFRSDMHTTNADGIRRRRHIWTSIEIESPRAMDIPLKEMDNSKQWSVQSGHPYPTLRAIFPTLFWRALDEDQSLSDQDKRTVAQCFVLHQPTNTPRLPDIGLWSRMMGIDQKSYEAIIQTLPCLGEISVHPPYPKRSRIEQCGLHAYCHNCSEILSHLGEAWNLRSSTERLTMTIKAFADMHDKNTIEEAMYLLQHRSFRYEVEPHVYSDTCTKARRKP